MHRREALKFALAAATAPGWGSIVGSPSPATVRNSAAEPPAASLARHARCPVSTAEASAPGVRAYDALRLSWNGCWIASPAVIAHPRSEEEVCRVVQWCRRENYALRVRSGGHSFIGDSLCDGVVIDMSALDAIAPGPAPATATIGGGATLGPVAATLFHGLGRSTCTLGTCDSVGISGLLLGGGFGLMSREHGLTIDALASARVVLADGSVVETDASRNPDLFWAIRGGGGSFGIVTEMVLRTRPWRAVHGVTQHWTWTDAPRVLRIWSAWIDTLPPGTSSSLVWTTSGTTTSSDIRTIVRSDRSADEAERCAASLSDALGTEPTREKSRTSGPPAAKPELRLTGPRSANASAFARAEVDAPTAERVAAAMEERRAGGRRFGDGTTMMICNGLGGAVAKVPREATAFAHRDARFLAEFAAEWTTDTADANAANGAWVRTVSDAVRPALGSGSYLNYADAGLVDWRRAYWGANLERLEAIKSRLDPTRSFGGRQSV